jgi:molybdopterin-guanine dinucleotide biosynthesis protein A
MLCKCFFRYLGGIDLKYSAIILAGGSSKRFGKDKSLSEFLGKPLIHHIIDRIGSLFDEVIVVLRNDDQRNTFSTKLSPSIKLVIDEYDINSPLIGAFSGFKYASGEYSLLTACDTPLISFEVIYFFLSQAHNCDAVIARWPNGYLEPLQAIYRTQIGLQSTIQALNEGKLRMRDMILHLNNPRFITTETIRKLDPQLKTFYNVNTVKDLARLK